MPELPERPRVSIAVICFNYGRFLPECLESCLHQSVSADQVVVVNDGSTDDTAAVLDEYAARHPQILAIHQPNRGICAATNVALAACTGDVVVLLDADDAMSPDRIEKVIAALRLRVGSHRPAWVHHRMVRFSDDRPNMGLAPYYPEGKGPEGWLADEALKAASTPVLALTSSLAFRRELLAAIEPLDVDRLMYQDQQLCAAATLLGPTAYVSEPLTRYRVHGASTSSGTMTTLQQVRAARTRVDRLDEWLRKQLDKRRSGASELWRSVEDQGGYLWLTFLERWLAGEGKDYRLLARVLRHPDTRQSPRQQRIYYYGSLVLPRPLFVSYSRLIFGSSPWKSLIRKLLGRD
jgi:glycosyltransferase involved in cell wall biosynthesis